MTSRWILSITMGAALAVTAPVELAAQGASQRGRQQQQQPQRMDAREAARREAERERLRHERERDERARMDERERARRAEWERERARQAEWERRNGRNGGRHDDWGVWDGRSRDGGPAFCRNGQGHPVHGRQWCREKGFGLGNERWERDRWGDIILRDRTRRSQQYGRATLADILGGVMVGRFESYGRRFGNGPLYGAWLPGSGGTVLQLSVGGIPIAQLVDYDRDGRVDNLLLRR